MNEIILKNQDCFDFLKNIKTETIDLVLIDPPYNISKNTNFAILGIKGNKPTFNSQYDVSVTNSFYK